MQAVKRYAMAPQPRDKDFATGIRLPHDLHFWARMQALKDSAETGRHITMGALIVEGLRRVKKARQEGKGHDDV
jgi:hypothetical protein